MISCSPAPQLWFHQTGRLSMHRMLQHSLCFVLLTNAALQCLDVSWTAMCLAKSVRNSIWLHDCFFLCKPCSALEARHLKLLRCLWINNAQFELSKSQYLYGAVKLRYTGRLHYMPSKDWQHGPHSINLTWWVVADSCLHHILSKHRIYNIKCNYYVVQGVVYIIV